MNNRIDNAYTSTHKIGRRDICYVDLGDGVGSEQAFSRPCLCIQNDTGNRYSPTTIIVPITSAVKKRMPTHVDLLPDRCGLRYESTVMCEQIRVIDKSRLGRYIGSVAEDTMREVDRALAVSIGLS